MILLKPLITSRSFIFCRLLGILYINNYVICKKLYFLFLPFQHVCFSSLACPVALAGPSSALLSEGGDNGHHYTAFPILGEDVQSSSIKDDVNFREFLVDILYEIEKITLYS